jgi:hypothetical protein
VRGEPFGVHQAFALVLVLSGIAIAEFSITFPLLNPTATQAVAKSGAYRRYSDDRGAIRSNSPAAVHALLSYRDSLHT